MDLHFASYPAIFLSFFLFVFMVLKILQKRVKTVVIASKLPPGPWKLPLVGNMHQVLGSSLVHHTLRDLAKKHGPLMYLRLGQVPTLVVSSAEFAKEVMETHDATFASRPASLYTRIVLYDTKDIVFAPYGEYWRWARKICVKEVLSPARVQSFRPIREEEMLNLVKWIASNEGFAINLSKKIKYTSYLTTSRAAFGKESKVCEEFISVVEEAVELSKGHDLSDLFPSFNFLALISPLRPRLERLRRKVDRIVESIINEHQKAKSAAKTCEAEDKVLIDLLLEFREKDEDGFSLTSDHVKAIIWDVFVAGSETSATTVDWAMAEMIKNPRVMKKAQEEVREVFRRKGLVDETGTNEMTYLKCVVKETLRLHPPLPLLIPRESRDRCEITGYEIPEKTRVMVNVWAIGRDPRYWTEPESFIPERFLDSSIDYKGKDFEYTPFGAGRRICPGMSFGMISTELLLMILLFYFDWKLPNGNKHEDLDMNELFAVVVGRKNDLELLPTVYDLSPITNVTT